MARQHATPIMLTNGSAVPLTPLSLLGGENAVSESAIQQLIQEHPSCLPIAEIDPMFSNPVPICTELNTTAGPIDNFMVTASGLPVLVECKLWRNPEMRRQVVGQILDYAKELSRWSSSDLQRETSRRLGRPGNVMLELVREAHADVDETEFNDAITANLRRGRFLLLIVGDGIREGVEAIAEYLQLHAGLHFTLGLVELPIYTAPDGNRIVVPRIVAKTHVVRREVVATPPGYVVQAEEVQADPSTAGMDPSRDVRRKFLEELIDGFELVDPEQPRPKLTPAGYLYIYMPAPKSSAWITVSARTADVGLYLSANRDSLGDKALQRLATDDWAEVSKQLGGSAEVRPWYNDKARYWIAEFRPLRPFDDETDRQKALQWLRERMTTWISVLRPRIRAIVAESEQAEA